MIPPSQRPSKRAMLRQSISETYRQQAPLQRLSRTISPIAFVRFLRCLTPSTLRAVVQGTFQQRLPSLASEMAYNAMLGLFPGMLTLLTAIGLFESLKQTFLNLAADLREIAPEAVFTLIQNFSSEVVEGQNRSLFSLSFFVALWAASGAMSAAMRALDQIHQIPLSQRRPFWKARLISIALTVGTILLLITASYLIFISDLVIRLLANQSGETIGSWVLNTWRLFSWPLALGMVASAFAFVYRFGPSHWTRGKPLLPGAVLAALTWALLSTSFRLYVSHFGNYNKVYGAVGTVIILLLWLFLTSLVMLIGDQLNVTVGRVQYSEQPAAPPVSRPQGRTLYSPGSRDPLPSLDKSTIKRPYPPHD
ncbi:MAG: YihY/virulence factor BrkB family protein [Cyanobacteria bacterium P01_A01_bin.105]